MNGGITVPRDGPRRGMVRRVCVTVSVSTDAALLPILHKKSLHK